MLQIKNFNCVSILSDLTNLFRPMYHYREETEILIRLQVMV